MKQRGQYALGAALAVILVTWTGHARAESFGIHFLGNTSDNVAGSAGVVPISGWNNIANATFASGTILSSDGLASITLTRSGPGRANVWHSGSVTDGGNGSLLAGYNDVTQNNPATNVISGLTGPAYTIYLYTAGDAARPGNNGDWLPNYTVNGAEYCTATLNGSGVFPGFTQGGITSVNTSAYPPPVVYGNYIEIDNVTPVIGVVTISAGADTRTWRSPLNGIEIVARSNKPLIKEQPASLRLYNGVQAQFSVV